MAYSKKSIASIANSKGKSAAEFTHALKVFGDGDMRKAIPQLIEDYRQTAKRNLTEGRVQGVMWSSLTLAAIITIAELVRDERERKRKELALEAKRKAIIDKPMFTAAGTNLDSGSDDAIVISDRAAVIAKIDQAPIQISPSDTDGLVQGEEEC